MKHLIISRELPPATYPAGGIGAYVVNIARLLAENGDTVHLIGERWRGSPHERETLLDGRLIVHRIGATDLPPVEAREQTRARRELAGLHETVFPHQWFAWSAASLTERLVEEEGIDVIEAQEWEAPLYYFLLRRSLGLGPERRPPCIVHLHSPSVVIHHYNSPGVTPPSLPWTMRMEEFCIRSADALLCPGRRLAMEAERRFGIAANTVEVIPLPVGFAPRIDRDEAVWADGAICYVGRLEPRKGVIEWVESAARVAREHPHVHFDFVGADIWNLESALRGQIGRDLAPRFRFHGPKSKKEIATFLAKAMAGVVPSRWENFPNVCIEAMASGLPVIATRYGAMAELLEDGRSGWLAEDSGMAGMTDSLADALRRCLATTPRRRAAMGGVAAEAVRRICDNKAVVAAHQRFRAAVLARGAVRSLGASVPGAPVGSANVVVRTEVLEAADGVLRSLEEQTMTPHAVAVVYRRSINDPPDGYTTLGTATELLFQHSAHVCGTQAWNAGYALLGAGSPPAFWMFLDEHDALEPDCLERMAGVLAARPDIGVATPWTERTGPAGRFDAHPSPSVAHQMIDNEVAPASAFNARALDATGPFRSGLPREHDVWALANEVMAKGWAAATLPFLLARRTSSPMEATWPKATALRAMRAEALRPFETDEYRLALQVVDAFAPVRGSRSSPSGQRLRRLFLRRLEAVLFRPGQVLHRCLRVARIRPWRRASTHDLFGIGGGPLHLDRSMHAQPRRSLQQVPGERAGTGFPPVSV
jgi:glycosyltransferase involved in cell wall biosynthesis